MKSFALIAASLAGLVGLLYSRSAFGKQQPNGAPSEPGSLPVIGELLQEFDLSLIPDKRATSWIPDQRSEPYLGLTLQAERDYKLPPYLLARLIEQESAWDPWAHNQRTDASGLAQIVPRWHPNVDPFAPVQAIPYAARYLRENFERFGSWEHALAAYNWGPGNVTNWIRAGATFAQLPSETQNYVTKITRDVAV